MVRRDSCIRTTKLLLLVGVLNALYTILIGLGLSLSRQLSSSQSLIYNCIIRTHLLLSPVLDSVRRICKVRSARGREEGCGLDSIVSCVNYNVSLCIRRQSSDRCCLGLGCLGKSIHVESNESCCLIFGKCSRYSYFLEALHRNIVARSKDLGSKCMLNDKHLGLILSISRCDVYI